MRLTALILLSFLALPMSGAVADQPVAPRAREIIIAPEVEPPRRIEAGILKRLTDRVRFDPNGRDRREGFKLRVRLLEFQRGADGVKQRIDVKPEIGDGYGLTFVWRF